MGFDLTTLVVIAYTLIAQFVVNQTTIRSRRSVGIRCPIDQIGMLVIGCSVALDGKWKFLFFILAFCAIGCSVGHGGYWMSY
jgi:hypothetical protein